MKDDSHLESVKPIVKERFNSLSDQRATISTNIASDLALVDGKAVCHEDGYGHYKWPNREDMVDEVVAQSLNGHITKLPFKYNEETLAINVSAYLAVVSHTDKQPYIAPDLKSAIRELSTGETGGLSAKKAFEKIQPTQETTQPAATYTDPQQDLV